MLLTKVCGASPVWDGTGTERRRSPMRDIPRLRSASSVDPCHCRPRTYVDILGGVSG
jgi:hypothetical protein